MKKTFLLYFLAMLAACHSPERYEARENSGSESGGSDFGTIYDVNGGHQICNPSVTMDERNFPASMLWLNFSGTLNVTDAPKDFSVNRVGEHDRLTISDTAGRVLWFLMTDSVPGADCEFQDPEWAADGRFVVALGGFNAKGSKGCDDIEYGIFAARLSDNATFFLVDSAIGEYGDPHLWVGEPAETGDSASFLEKFFGTRNVKLVYSDGSGLVYVDYAKSEKPVRLFHPDSVPGSELGNPLISPDGKFVVYHRLASSYEWNSYVQELSPDSKPVEIGKTDGMLSNPVFPHWWSFNDRLYVVWAEFAAGNSYLNKNDLLKESTWDASVGRTAMREISVTAGAPRDVSVELLGNVREIAPVPLIGGRSPEGHFVSTGTNNGYLLYIP